MTDRWENMKTFKGGVVAIFGVSLVLGFIAVLQTQAQDIQTIVSLARQEAAKEPVAEKTVPVFSLTNTTSPGTYWSMQLDQPPLPFCPFPELPLYEVDPTHGIYLLDDRSVDYAGLNAQIQEEQTTVRVARSLTSLAEGGEMEALDDGGSGESMALLSYSSNDLWLEIISITNGAASVVLHGVQAGEVYELMSKRQLTETQWNPEQVLHTVTNQDWIAAAVPVLDRTNSLFLWAGDWTGIDANTNSLPDWWEWENFGNFNQTASGDYDSDGFSNLSEYNAGFDPNTILFSLGATNQYVKAGTGAVRTTVLKGVPFNAAVLVDNTNFASASWMAYTSSNLPVSLGSVEGWHYVRAGLRGRSNASQQSWQGKWLKLDLTPPVLVITNPIVSVIPQPSIQLQGYSTEALASISYDITNAAGLLTNQPVLILDQYFSTNTMEFTTNYFQAFDVPLTNGLNIITLHAADLAGNVTTTNLSFTVDYSGDTNAPVIRLYSPQNGNKVSGSSLNCRGSLDDFTANLVAQAVGTNGITNSINGRVGSDGSFWIENLPLTSGTNVLTLIATDVAGNSSSTNFSVVKSDVTLTITSAPMGQSASGTISDPNNYTVWVNGVRATNNSDGTWTVVSPHLTLDNSVVQARAIPNSDNGGNGSGGGSGGGGGGSGGSGSGSGAGDGASNPNSPAAINAEMKMDRPDGYNYTKASFQVYDDVFVTTGFYILTEHYVENWQETTGGTGEDRVKWDPPHPFSPSYHQGYAWTGGRAPILGDGILTDLDSGATAWTGPPASSEASQMYIGTLSFQSPDGYINVNDTSQPRRVLITGGGTGFTGKELYRFTAGGWFAVGYPSSYGTTVALRPEQIKIGNLGYLNTGGVLYAALPVHKEIDVTPSVAGGNYTSVGLDVQPYKPRISFNGQDVTDATTTVIVGQKISLFVSFPGTLPADFPANITYSWTVPGYAISNYIADANTGQVYEDFVKTSNVVNFYWVSDGSKEVKCTIKLAGQELSAKTVFNVTRPNVQMTATAPGQLGSDTNFALPGTWLHCGGNIVGQAIVPGIEFVVQGANTNQYFFVQIGSSQENDLGADGTHYIGTGNGVDNGNDASSRVYPFDPNIGDVATDDFPASSLANNVTNVSRSDTFTMYLMFKPNVSGQSIPVPMKKTDWSWSATTVLTNASLNLWKLTSATAPNPITADTMSYPAWTNHMQPIQWTPRSP